MQNIPSLGIVGFVIIYLDDMLFKIIEKMRTNKQIVIKFFFFYSYDLFTTYDGNQAKNTSAINLNEI